MNNESKKIGVGVVGAGGIARRRTIPALMGNDRVDVVAVMDPVGGDGIAREFGIPRHYVDEAALVADPDVDVVYIASPVFLHAKQIRLAAEAGKHVFCEKPVGRTLAETRVALELCRSNGVRFMEGYMMNFHGAHRRIREMIAAGEIGRPVSMRAQLSCWYPQIANAWRQDPKQGGGGALIDLATHCYSLLEYVTGDRITGVFAMATSQVHDYRSEDSATTLLQFASGCHATVDTFFCMRDETSRNRLEIYGDGGAILAEGTLGQDSGGRLEAITGLGRADYDAGQTNRADGGYQSVAFEAVNPYAAEWVCFADAVLNGRDPKINDLADALHIAGVAEKAYASWREGRFLAIEAGRDL